MITEYFLEIHMGEAKKKGSQQYGSDCSKTFKASLNDASEKEFYIP